LETAIDGGEPFGVAALVCPATPPFTGILEATVDAVVAFDEDPDGEAVAAADAEARDVEADDVAVAVLETEPVGSEAAAVDAGAGGAPRADDDDEAVAAADATAPSVSEGFEPEAGGRVRRGFGGSGADRKESISSSCFFCSGVAFGTGAESEEEARAARAFRSAGVRSRRAETGTSGVETLSCVAARARPKPRCL